MAKSDIWWWGGRWGKQKSDFWWRGWVQTPPTKMISFMNSSLMDTESTVVKIDFVFKSHHLEIKIRKRNKKNINYKKSFEKINLPKMNYISVFWLLLHIYITFSLYVHKLCNIWYLHDIFCCWFVCNLPIKRGKKLPVKSQNNYVPLDLKDLLFTTLPERPIWPERFTGPNKPTGTKRPIKKIPFNRNLESSMNN